MMNDECVQIWQYIRQNDLIDTFLVSLLFTLNIKYLNINSLFPSTAWLWNSLPPERFPLSYDLSGFKFGVNNHLLSLGSF